MFFLLSKDKPKLPEVDLAFVISATTLDSQKNFKKSKDIIKEIVGKYGVNKIQYSVATFGSTLNRNLRFDLAVDSDERLLTAIDSLVNTNRGSALAEALEDSPKIFKEESGGRAEAKKILVLITDNKSDSFADDVEDAASKVIDEGIRVIAVGLDKADKVELDQTTPVGEDVLVPPTDETAENIAKDVMERVFNGNG